MTSKVSIKIDANLNKDLSIVSILESKTKEQFMEDLLKQGLKPFQDKIKSYKFS